MPSFTLTLHQAYYRQGFFNVPRAFDRFVTQEEMAITLALDGFKRIEAKVNRSANLNGTARIMGGVPLRDWFQANFELRSAINVEIESPIEMRMGSGSQGGK